MTAIAAAQVLHRRRFSWLQTPLEKEPGGDEEHAARPPGGTRLVAAAVIGGSGVAIGAATATPSPAATSVQAAASAPPAADGGARASYADVVRQVLPSVVLISTGEGLGSGVVLDKAGNIVTNAHVAGQATSFKVQVSGDPAPRTATLVGSYPPDDLAVIRVDDPAGLRRPRSAIRPRRAQATWSSPSATRSACPAASRAGSSPPPAGSSPNPPAPGQPGATLPDAIQTSAPINPGNSGGALVTTAAEVIGIPTLTAGGSAGGAQVQGIGFAIPSNLARDIAQQIITSGSVTNSHRAAIGAQVGAVTGQDGNPAGTGIVTVTSGGPADRAGLRAGDVIRTAGGTPVPDPQALAGVLAAARPEDRSPSR